MTLSTHRRRPVNNIQSFILGTDDNSIIVADRASIMHSNWLRRYLIDFDMYNVCKRNPPEPFNVFWVDGWTLKKIVKWCKMHRGEVWTNVEAIEPTEEDDAFLNVNSKQMYKLLLGALNLEVPPLLELIKQRINSLLCHGFAASVRKIFSYPYSDLEFEEIKLMFFWINEFIDEDFQYQ